MWRGVLPTFSMSPVRIHFWQLAARLKLGSPSPMNSRLNWFMPAGVKSTVGSLGTRTSLGRRTQPLDSKNSRNASRSSSVFMESATLFLNCHEALVGIQGYGPLEL